MKNVKTPDINTETKNNEKRQNKEVITLTLLQDLIEYLDFKGEFDVKM